MNALSGPSKKAIKPATSSGVPTRPAGWNACSSDRGCGPFVRIHPGLMQLTRTSGARLIDSACVSATRPPFEAAYASVSGSDIWALVDAIVTTLPFAARSKDSAARTSRNVAVRLVPMTTAHSAADRRAIGLRILMPALETTASNRPSVPRMSCTSLSTAASSATSHISTRPPGGSAAVLSLSATITRQPAPDRREAMAAPIPCPPPVTRTTRRISTVIAASTRSRCSGRHAGPACQAQARSASRLFRGGVERLRQVGQDVVDMLDADRQAHIAGGDAGCRLFGLGKLGVCSAGRMDRQAARIADIGDVIEHLQRIDEAAAGIGTPGELEAQQAALPARQVFRRAFRTDPGVVAGMDHPCYFLSPSQEGRRGGSVFAVRAHPQRQRLQPLQEQERVERRH